MSFTKLMLLIGFSLLLTSCASDFQGTQYNQKLGDSLCDKGVRYLLGIGVKRNDAKAFAFFKKAADKGDHLAENEVAYLYAAGKGTARNNKLAFTYYQKAANHGLASAQYNLGLMYRYGLGTEPNLTLAKHWIKKAANYHFEPARLTLLQLEA